MTYTHPHALIRAYTARVTLARDTYWAENHCHHCGAIVHPARSRSTNRLCPEHREAS